MGDTNTIWVSASRAQHCAGSQSITSDADALPASDGRVCNTAHIQTVPLGGDVVRISDMGPSVSVRLGPPEVAGRSTDLFHLLHGQLHGGDVEARIVGHAVAGFGW